MVSRVWAALLLLLVFVAGPAAGRPDDSPRRMHDRDGGLKAAMRSMMSDEDEDGDLYAQRVAPETAPKSGFLQVSAGSSQQGGAEASMDDYIKESEDALSTALGPRWNSKTLDQTAKRTTSALLRGISSRHALGRLLGIR
mmetsp:Transcript_107528/g.302671  ORF Transcript_107528/g.302671 Transcript_107528/m.302671 type:complete len:140 (+) Transcript_107528:58-477(+)